MAKPNDETVNEAPLYVFSIQDFNGQFDRARAANRGGHERGLWRRFNRSTLEYQTVGSQDSRGFRLDRLKFFPLS
jgi:hypothetical protein